MGKSFKGDRRFEKKRDRQQFRALVKGEDVPGFGTTNNMRRLHAAQAEAQYQRTIRQQRQAYDEQRMRERDERIQAQYVDAGRRLNYGLQAMSSGFAALRHAALYGGRAAQTMNDGVVTTEHITSEDILEAFYSAYATIQGDPTHRKLSNDAVAKLLALPKKPEDFSKVKDIDTLIVRETPIRCGLYPANVFGAAEEQHTETLMDLQRIAAESGIEFYYEGSVDITLNFSKVYFENHMNMDTFLSFCAKRLSGPYGALRAMAAASAGPVKRKTRLDD